MSEGKIAEQTIHESKSSSNEEDKASKELPWDHNPLIVKPGETAEWTYTEEEDVFFEDFMRWCEHDKSALNFQRQVVRMSMSFCAQMGNGVQQAMYTHEMKMQFDDFVEDFEVHILQFLDKHKFEPTDFLNLTVRKLQSLNCTEEYLAQLTLLAADFSAFVGVLRNESFTHCMERSLHEKLGDDEFVAWKRKAVKEIQEEIKQSKEEMRANMARSKAAIEEQNDKMRSKYSTKGKYDAVQGQLAAKGKAAIAEEEKPPAAASTRKSHK